MAECSNVDSDHELLHKELGSKIAEVLKGAKKNSIRIHSFWGKFCSHHGLNGKLGLPNPVRYGLKKKREILTNSRVCRIITGPDGYEYVELEDPVRTEKRREPNKSKSSEIGSQSARKKASKQCIRTDIKSKKGEELKASLFTFSDRSKKSSPQLEPEMSGGPPPWLCGPGGGRVPQGQQPYQHGFFQNHPHQQGQMFNYQNRSFQGQNVYQNYNQPGPSRAPNKPVQHIPKDQINAVAQDCIDRLAEAKEYVSIERVEKLLLDYYKVETLQEIGVRHIEHVKTINEHIRTQVRVNGYIQGFVRIRAIATLYELHENLREYTPDRQDFETLKLGPLTKQPMVYDYFKFPHDADIQAIETKDVLNVLRQYLTDTNLWMAKVELDGFMTHVASVYNVDTPFALGLRIKSMPLAVGLLKKSQRDLTQATKAAVDACHAGAEEEIKLAYRNFTSSIVEHEGGMCKVRQDLMKLSAGGAVEQVFSKFKVLLRSLMYSAGSAMNKEKNLAKKVATIEQFTQILKKDTFLQRVFQTLVCSTWEQVHNSLQSLIGLNSQEEEEEDNGQATGSSKAADRQRPELASVVKLIKQYLERCFVHGNLNLTHLARIENKLLEDLGDFENFVQVTNATFLDFVTTNDDVKQYLDENGGVVLGMQHGGSARSASGYHAALYDLQDFIMQSALIESDMSTSLEQALCWHYKVAEAKFLGHGSVISLQSGAIKAQRHNKQQSVFFESALSAKESQNMFGVCKRKVGLLGSQSREAALLCLYSCPLLENMAEWTHWEVVFKPELGELKDFIRKNGGVQTFSLPNQPGKTVITKIVAIETKPGKLLKLTSDTSNDAFASAAAAADARATCGHLMSLITSNKGVSKTPLALLGNHFKTGLLKMQGSTAVVLDKVTGFDISVLSLGRFVVQCLTRLPFVTCQAVADQVFLEPLTCVVGQTKSRELLPKCVSNVEEQNRLQLLGLVLGIDQWSGAFKDRLKPPVDLLHASPKKKQIEDEAYVLIDSDEEDVESSDSEESDFLNSSDESDDEAKLERVKTEQVRRSHTGNRANDEDEAMIIEISEEDSSVIILNESSAKQEESVEEVEPSEEDEEKDNEEPDNPCLAVINDIRRTEFGINVTLSAEGEKLMKKQQERQGRSLDRLSDELYSKDSHFVLELIQNADDNNYSPDIVPALKFVVEIDKITVLNNETGFTESNIRAICDVGKSTKGKHKAGYIGQKGIGFKSVFRVTDRPTIHSGGYHFKFDKSTGPIGYILPHWITEKYDLSNRWATSILLPLKDDAQQVAKLRQLAARFQDVHPSLLLFLHRLRSITILNKIGDYKAKMERTDIGNNIIELRHMTGSDRQTSKIDRWIVVKKTLDATGLSVQAKSGVEVESTEIALAFPLHEVEDLQAQELPPKQPVFAFLPLRTYGFRFVVQGDFDVPSSREDICHDSMWNQWLQSAVHTLFVEALEVFKNQKNLSAVEAVCLFIKFIPLEDEVLDFFRPVASQILQRLRSQPCLPTAAAPGAAPEWRLPSQLVLATDPLLMQVATQELLQTELGLYYLHSEVGSKINSSLLTSLGVQTLSTAHLVELGRAFANKISQASSIEKSHLMNRIAKWFAALFRSLDEFDVDKKVLDQVKELALVPLSNGEFVSLGRDSIFFPLAAEERREANKKNDLLLFLEKDLNTVSTDLFSQLDNIAKPQVWRVLEMMGVRKLLPADIINHHIIPALKALDSINKPSGLLISYLVYMKEELDRQPHLVPLEVLRELAVVMTNQGFKKPAKESVHFSPQYMNRVNLQKDLPGLNWVLVGPVYLERSKTNLDIQTWRNFFTKLGVTDVLSVSEEQVTVTRQDILESAWAKYLPLLPKTEQQFVFIDYECSEFLKLVTENTEPRTFHKQMQMMFDILDAYWEKDYSDKVVTRMKNTSGQDLIEVETTFGMLVKQLDWVPFIQRTASTDFFTHAQGKRGEAAGCKLFIQSNMMERLLANHVPYLDPLVPMRSQLPQFIEVQSTLTTEIVIELLVRWGSRTALNTPQSFTSSLSHMKAVYLFLHERLPPKQLQDLFHDHPVIFVPSLNPGELHDPQHSVEGKMMSRNEVRWEDPTKLFLKYSSSLEDMGKTSCVRPSVCVWYSDLEQVMIHSARVMRHPTYIEMAELIIAITNTHPVPPVLADIMQLYMHIGTDIENATATSESSLPPDLEQLVQKLKQHAVLPSKEKKWKKVSDKPLIADDRQMEMLFSKKEGVNFLATEVSPANRRLGQRQYRGTQHIAEAVISLYQALGVETLSQVLTSEFVTESFQTCPKLHSYIASVLPYIQACIYTQFQEVYDGHVKDNIASKTKRMQFVQVGRLEVVYRLRPFPDVAVAIGETCKLKDNSDEFTFYIHKDSTEATYEINKELARYFSRSKESCSREIKNLLIDLMPLVRNQSPELKHFMDVQGIVELPEDEVRWSVPPVQKPRIPSPPPLPPPRTIPEVPERPDTPSSQFSGSGGPTCWPPRSDPAMASRPGAFRGAPQASSIWPPPAPSYPPSRPDFTNVPSNLRPARTDFTQESQAPGSQQQGPGPAGDTLSEGGQSQHSQSGHGPGQHGHGSGQHGHGSGQHGHGSGQHGHGSGQHGHGPGHPSDVQGSYNGGPDGSGSSYQGGDGTHLVHGHPDSHTGGHPGSQSGAHPGGAHPGGAYPGGARPGEVPMEDSSSELVQKVGSEPASGPPPGAGGLENDSLFKKPTDPSLAQPGQKRMRYESGMSSGGISEGEQLWFDVPEWGFHNIEETLEEKDWSSQLPKDFDLDEDAGRLLIGRWGEQFVYNYLLTLMDSEDSKVVDVNWVNKFEESELPYDIDLSFYNPETETADHVFVEVKATRSDKKAFFPMSHQELDLAFEKKEAFHLYRVYNAGIQGRVRLTKIENLAAKIGNKTVRLCLVI